MPYESDGDGNWTTQSTWLHGDVWDIEDEVNNKDWNIVRINSKVFTSKSHTQLGMIIENNNTLTVTSDEAITNTWYLELNGTLDLIDDSQLVQGENSDLVTSATGKILRRQEGHSDVFWYNYWASPVGATAATSLIDNNTTSNNPNNTAFSLNTLKEGNGSTVQFTSAYNEVGKISTRWMYTFENGVDYFDWANLSPSSSINTGVGYIHKGIGYAGNDQQYIFEGKPNNGTILLNGVDKGGPGSVDDVSKTLYLTGNPYPSAIDARKFIADNAGVIEGTIEIWEQWAGDSHILLEYEGGYAYINSMTTERAYQHAGIPISSQSQPNGLKKPSFNVAVAQGFFVEVLADGNIEFNNKQRVFAKEMDGGGSDPNDGSMFFEANDQTENIFGKSQEESEATAPEFQLLRLEFGMSNGASRSFVVGFGKTATDGYDYGLDGGIVRTVPADDMGTLLNDEQLVIQAFAPIKKGKEIDLAFKASGEFTYTIKSTELTNFPKDQAIYLRDNLKGTYHNLRSKKAYRFKSKAGQFNDRFDIVFKSGVYKANQIDNEIDNAVIYFNTNSDKLFVKGLNTITNQLTLTNMLGQNILNIKDVSTQSLVDGLPLTNLTSGIYIVSLRTDTNQNIDKKIIID